MNFRDEIQRAEKAAMGEMFNLAKNNLKDGSKIINFASGHPATDVFQDEMIKKYMTLALEEGEKDILQYGPHIGYPELRYQFRIFANEKGNNIKDEDEIMITYGNCEGIFLSAFALVNKGDMVAVEEPSYVNAIKTFQITGANVVSVKQDEDGVNLESLEFTMKKGLKLFYTIPNFSNPSGITMSEKKRREVYRLAKKYNVLIIEDNAYGDLRYRGTRIKNIKEYDDDGRVIYLCSMSKLIAPAVRTGFLVASKELVNKLTIIKAISSNGVTPIIQKALAIMFDKENIYDEISKICNIYGEKMQAMIEAMNTFFPEDVVHSLPDGGMYIWVTLPKGLNIMELCRKSAVDYHIPITPGIGFCVAQGELCTSLRFNFVKENIDDIRFGIKQVGMLMEKMYD